MTRCQESEGLHLIPASVIRRLALVTVLVLALALVACGDDASDGERAAERLEEALSAHAEGKTEDAREGYEDVLDLEAGNQFAHYNLGLIHQEAGELEEAEASYRRALQTDQSMASALFNLAILRTEPAPAEAEELYRSVVTVQPDNASAHLNLGFLLIDQGDEAEGQVELGRAVELDPSLARRISEEEEDGAETEVEEPGTTSRP